MKRRGLAIVIGVLALILYLRDPVWLARVDSGFGGWERNRAGIRFRWMMGRASFFVPSDTKAIDIPLHALFITANRAPFIVRVAVNDRIAGGAILPDERWVTAHIPVQVPASWSRRVVRIDLHVNRTWSERSLGVQVGEVKRE